MKARLLSLLCIITFSVAMAQNLPKPASGSIIRLENFQSEFVPGRNVDIWLPEDYSARKKYAVLYMHDGQMLFDSTTTWNHQSWDVDNVATELLQHHKVLGFIIVGVSNGGKTRHADYFPQKPFESLTQDQKDLVTLQLQGSGRTTETKPLIPWIHLCRKKWMI